MGLNFTTDKSEILADHPVFVEKLAERLAFETSAHLLYGALIDKFKISEHKERLPDLARIEQFYQEEQKHIELISKIAQNLDENLSTMQLSDPVNNLPTTQWIETMKKEETTFLQSLEIILQTELLDNVGWELLIELAERHDLSQYAIEFQTALDQEVFHLLTIKQWVQELTLNEEIISPEQNFIVIEGNTILKH